ncbi:MAG: hypothetical protein WD341_11070 [Tistlia sp.]|uniref:hypothetical protein n=1 Tax=Tistlia sp. TaxID=3057121 RepID=UPI0034A1AE73
MSAISLSRLSLAALALLGGLALAQPGQAQLNNQPFSFRTPDGGPGMSFAGRQAIIDAKLLDARPANLLRGPGGELVSVEKGPGGTAIVRDSSGAPLPGYRGSSWRGPGDFAGSFNSFFVPGPGGVGFGFRFATAAGAVIGGWTDLLGASFRAAVSSYAAESPLNDWIAMVAFLPPLPGTEPAEADAQP